MPSIVVKRIIRKYLGTPTIRLDVKLDTGDTGDIFYYEHGIYMIRMKRDGISFLRVYQRKLSSKGNIPITMILGESDSLETAQRLTESIIPELKDKKNKFQSIAQLSGGTICLARISGIWQECRVMYINHGKIGLQKVLDKKYVSPRELSDLRMI